MDASSTSSNPRALDDALVDLRSRGWSLQKVSHIKQGKTNDSFMVTNGKQWFVLRVNHRASETLGIDRQLEQRILQCLPNGIGLPLEVLTEHYMLTPFVRARSQPLSNAELGPFMALLHGIHEIDLGDDNIDYLGRLLALLPVAYHPQWGPTLTRFREHLQRVEEMFGYHRALCHHDLVPENILWSVHEADATPWIIDWEYAAMGDLFFDLACIVESHNIPERRHAVVLQSYGLNLALVKKLRLYRAIYVALAAAWNMRCGVSSESQMDYIEHLLSSI
ncbi:MAG TPA: phosphotransferase [Pseudomonadales bacterium]|nr:phosphotransferase [Pseudomonadales bacterium]